MRVVRADAEETGRWVERHATAFVAIGKELGLPQEVVHLAVVMVLAGLDDETISEQLRHVAGLRDGWDATALAEGVRRARWLVAEHGSSPL